VIVMAKAPLPGYAKTRLIPALGAAGAAALALRLLEHTVDQAVAAGLGPVLLCCAPDDSHPAFQQRAADTRLLLAAQGDGDLGARMQRALARALQNGGRAVMVGTDAPALDARRLREAAAALDDHDAVFVPAHDGGYALIGVRRPAPRLFEHMPWSTSKVMATTRQRLESQNWSWTELAPVHDIDEPADLVHLPPGWAA
jgi:rSAM/selenodomain-associated transferase 1